MSKQPKRQRWEVGITPETSDDHEEEESDEEYHDDAAYRLRHGPDIAKWGDHGFDESLVGLKIVFDFPHGKCEGTVRSVKDSKHNDDSTFNVIWTCNAGEEFLSVLSATDVVAWYLYGREKPSWVDGEEKFARDCSLFTVDPKAKMTNFVLPGDANYIFPWVDEEREDRWWTTLACLNDPDCASQYDPTGKRAYPMPLLLTIIAICRHDDPSVKLPMIISDEKKMVIKQADTFARLLNQPGGRTGYRSLEELEKIVQKIYSFIENKRGRDTYTDNAWKYAYQYCEALILTLSSEFENENDSWRYADAPARINKTCAKLISSLGTVLLHPPSEDMRLLLAKDLDHISPHLLSGNFVEFVEEEDFCEEFPDEARMWERLTALASNHQ